MKKSIFTKLFIMMLINIVVFTLLLYFANYAFADEYYIKNKKDLLIEVSQEINTLLKDAELPLSTKLVKNMNVLAKSIGGSVIVGDANRNVYYSERQPISLRPNADIISPFFEFVTINNKTRLVYPDQRRPQQAVISDWEQYDDHSIFFNAKDPELEIDTLRFQTILENDLTLLIWVPISGITENIDLSNRFTTIVAFITLSLTTIASFFISKQFTKPITNMNTLAKKMVDLDFTNSLNVDSQDEIGQLATTINLLSSKLKDTIEELNQKNQELTHDINKERQVETMRKEFISSVSHELKTPIFLIQGYAEGLLSNVVDDEHRRLFYSQVIMEEADKMDVIVKDLLDISQLESGTFSIQPCGFILNELVKDIIKKMTPTLEAQEIKVIIHFATNIKVHADPIRIEQVILNLLTNAINHCSGDKEIVIDINENLIVKKAKFSISNTGHSIAEEALDKIWTSFYKVDESRTRDYNGSGLGLSIVKNILEVHDNKYGVSNLVNGVQFWFELDLLSDS